MKRLAFMLICILAPTIALAQEAQPVEKSDSVLLVYSVGTPLAGFGVEKVSAEALDAVTGPTQTVNNTEIAARKIYDNLTSAGVAVRMAQAEEFARADWKQLLRYKTIVMGTPTRFGNMSWEMKRFMDEVVHQIYMQVPGRATGIQFALFATSAGEGGSSMAIRTMEEVVSNCKGSVVGRLGLYTRQNEEEFDQGIAGFCNVLSILAH